MANKQRRTNDMATIDRRENVDRTIRDNRIKNDDLTIKRRFRADELTRENRLKNDQMTIDRRQANDRNPMALAVLFFILIVLIIGAVYFYLK